MRTVSEVPAGPADSASGTGGLLRALGTVYVFATPLDFVPSPIGTPATIAGFLFIAQWLVALGAGYAVLPRRNPAWLFVGGLAVWSAITSIWSVAPDVSLRQALTVALLGLSAVAIAGTFRGSLRSPAWALVLGSGVAAVAALLSGPVPTRALDVREQSTFLQIDQNALAFHLCLGLAASFFLVLSERRAVVKVAFIGSALLLVAAIFSVGSRTGAGVVVGSSLVFVAVSAKSVRTALAGGAMLLAALWILRWMLSAGIVPTRLLDWYQNPVFTDSRSAIISQFMQSRDEWMVRGVGAGADADYLLADRQMYRNAHSAFWKTWIELGLLGVGLGSAFLASVIRQVARAPDRSLFLLATPAVIAFFYTLGPVNSNALWALFGLALGTQASAARKWN